jgi:hypothetical protein
MEIGGAASAILFGIVTVVQLLLSFLVLSYAGYSFLTVFINTSAGTDEVLWPKDPFQDWMWKSWYLAWLLAIWAIPVWLLTNLLNPPLWQFALIVVGFLWLMFPIGLLSSLSASSRWVVLRPVIVGMFLKNIVPTLAFYGITATLFAGWGVLLYYAILGNFYFVPLAAFVGTCVFFIYARLLGRIGWVFTQQHPEEGLSEGDDDDEEAETPAARRGSAAGKQKPEATPKPSPAPAPQANSLDPWAASLEKAIRKGTKPAPHVPSNDDLDPYGPASGSYDVLPDDQGWRRSSHSTGGNADREVDTYGLSGSIDHPKYPTFEIPEPDEPPEREKGERPPAVR